MSTAFATLAKFHIPSQSRLVSSACCPDKDLIVLISRLGSLDRLSLWNTTQGTKIWEVEVGEGVDTNRIIDIAWSPDGQSVAVLCDPLSISIRSIQDGRKVLNLNLGFEPLSQSEMQVSGLWWFQDEKKTTNKSIPDIFKRGDLITGSSLSILKSLPLLDSLPDDLDKITATDIFAFQGSQPRSSHRIPVPEVIQTWPALVSDPLSASICPPGYQSNPDSDPRDEAGITNEDSLLVVADNSGRLLLYQDGSFPLGRIRLKEGLSTHSLYRTSSSPVTLCANMKKHNNDHEFTMIPPVQIDIPLLNRNCCKQLSHLSSAARELVWYSMRIVKEMRSIWFGSDTNLGAREWGPRWVRSLETKQKEQFGREEPTVILDLTCLLVTGRASESLLDFLGSGEQMSERGIQKWETSVTESLTKLRDYAEKQLAPALQRLHLILEEIQGWSLLPQYSVFELPFEEISNTLDAVARGITCASWLSVAARKEFTRFREFISWLRFETGAANTSNETHAIPRHDILEVNAYMMSGLVVSSIDKWFIGPVPQFTPRDLGIPTADTRPLNLVLEQIRNVVNDPKILDWQTSGTRKDLNHIERNLDALVQDLAVRCQRNFSRAAVAPSRSAVVSAEHLLPPTANVIKPEHDKTEGRIIRERIFSKEDEIVQYLAGMVPTAKDLILLARLRLDHQSHYFPAQICIGAVQCFMPADSGQHPVNIVEFEFFDNETLAVIYRCPGLNNSAFIATISYIDIELEVAQYVKGNREELMVAIVELWRNKKSTTHLIEKYRKISTPRSGGFTMAVNGRVGRRVACVLDGTGTSMESFDLEGDDDDMDVAE